MSNNGDYVNQMIQEILTDIAAKDHSSAHRQNDCAVAEMDGVFEQLFSDEDEIDKVVMRKIWKELQGLRQG